VGNGKIFHIGMIDREWMLFSLKYIVQNFGASIGGGFIDENLR
jgi:hypothetical protein